MTGNCAAGGLNLNSVIWIASMTKAITATAAMQLVEQGKLSLDEPIGKVLPLVAAPNVLEGFDDAGIPILRPAKRPVTLRHLMTHTAGYCYGIWNARMARRVALEAGSGDRDERVDFRRSA